MKKLELYFVLLVCLASLLVLGACDTTTTDTASARYPRLWSANPTRFPFIVLGCKFADVSSEPHGLLNEAALFLTSSGEGLGNMADYYADVSYGAISLDGSRVMGWYNAPFTQTSLAGPNNRAERVSECANAAPPKDVDFSHYYGVIMLTNAINDGGACYIGQQEMQIHNQNHSLACVVFDADSLFTAFAAHEIGHALGLGHSYDNTQHFCSRNAKRGEYCDPWDIMSARVTFAFQGGHFLDPGNGYSDGPGMNAPNLLRQGWIPNNRIGSYHFGDPTATFTLAALSHPNAPGDLTVEIYSLPLPVASVYTLEYRQQDGWDAGIPHNTVLIHEYRRGQTPSSILQRNVQLDASLTSGEWLTGMTWDVPSSSMQVHIDTIDPTTGTATITIGTPIPTPTVVPTFSTAPLVHIQSPADGTHVAEGIPFQVTAQATTYDGHPLPASAVIWTVNGSPFGTGSTLTTTLNAPGAFTISVTGTDHGQSASDSITLYVDAPTPLPTSQPTSQPTSPPSPPTVQILAPLNGTLYQIYGISGSFTLPLSAQGSAGVTKYAWHDSLLGFSDANANDTLTLNPATSVIPCNTSWKDTVTVTVTDSHGQTATAAVMITISRSCLT